MSRRKKFLIMGMLIFTSLFTAGYLSLFVFRDFSTDPESKLLLILHDHKVLMLDDFMHSAALPYKSLGNLLTKWVQSLKAGNLSDRHLTLVLECDSVTEAHIKAFMDSGVLPPPRELAAASLERLEFFEDLRHLHQDIQAFNKGCPTDDRISFDILGTEPAQDFKGAYTRMNAKEGLEFFTYERDQLSAARVIEYSNLHPERKLLFFYGGAHLIRGLRNKDQWGLFPKTPSKGYYLIHYLDEHFGKDRVFAVFQHHLYPVGATRISKVCDFLTGKTATSSVFLTPSFIEKLAPWFFEERIPDAYILRRSHVSPPLPLAAIPLPQVVTVARNRLEELGSATGFLAQREKRFILDAIQIATRQVFPSDQDFFAWCTHGSLEPWTAADGSPEESKGFPWTKSPETRNLYKTVFGFSNNDFTEKSSSLTLRKIRVINDIGSMWIGNDQDKARAKQRLLLETNLDADTPGPYLVWLRKNLYHLNY